MKVEARKSRNACNVVSYLVTFLFNGQCFTKNFERKSGHFSGFEKFKSFLFPFPASQNEKCDVGDHLRRPLHDHEDQVLVLRLN